MRKELAEKFGLNVVSKKLTREVFEDGFKKAKKELKERKWSDHVQCPELSCHTFSIEIDFYSNSPWFCVIGEITMIDLGKQDNMLQKLYQLERACVFAQYCEPCENLLAVLVCPQEIGVAVEIAISTKPNLTTLHSLFKEKAFRTIRVSL